MSPYDMINCNEAEIIFVLRPGRQGFFVRALTAVRNSCLKNQGSKKVRRRKQPFVEQRVCVFFFLFSVKSIIIPSLLSISPVQDRHRGPIY